MGLLARCDAPGCKSECVVRLRPVGGDRFVVSDGWAYMPAGLAANTREPVTALVACSEPCLLKLHEAKERAAPKPPPTKGAKR